MVILRSIVLLSKCTRVLTFESLWQLNCALCWDTRLKSCRSASTRYMSCTCHVCVHAHLHTHTYVSLSFNQVYVMYMSCMRSCTSTYTYTYIYLSLSFHPVYVHIYFILNVYSCVYYFECIFMHIYLHIHIHIHIHMHTHPAILNIQLVAIKLPFFRSGGNRFEECTLLNTTKTQ